MGQAEIGSFLEAMAGGGIALMGEPEVRATDLRFTWDFQVSGATVFPGVDYVQLAPSGQLEVIAGYWEPFTNSDPIDSVTAYVEAWNATDDSARATALDAAVSDAVRFIDASQDANGADALTDVIADARDDGLATVTSLKLQGYGAPRTHARVELTLEDDAGGTTTVTDYLRFDAAGLIEQVGRFAEP